MKKYMARVLAVVLVIVFIIPLFAGCANKEPEVQTTAELYEKYLQSEGMTNHRMHSTMSIGLDVEQDDDTTLSFPMTMTRDEQIAGDLKHMSLNISYTGDTEEESGDVSIEAYRTSDGDYLKMDDDTWTSAAGQYLFESDDGFITKDIFAKGDLMVTDAGDIKSYTVTIPMSAYTDAMTLQDTFYDIGLANMIDTVELTKALMKASIVYTFDENYNLTGMHCDPVESYAVYTEDVDGESKSYNAKISYSLSYTFFDFGKVSETEITMPADAVIVQPDTDAEIDVEEPEAQDAAPSGADLPETP